MAVILLAGTVGPLAVQRLRENGALAVEVARVRLAHLAPSVLATGTLAWTSQVTLMPQVLGRVSALRVSEGERVHAGEIVVELDASDADAELAQFVAAQQQAHVDVQRDEREADYRAALANRYGVLRAQGVVTQTQYDEFAHADEAARLELEHARQALRRAAAQVAQAREGLAKTAIRAPMDGQVSSIDTRPGETVVPSVSNVAGSVLMTIANPSEMLAEVEIDEADLAQVRPGQPARVTVASDPDTTLRAVVQKIAVLPTQAPRGRVYKARLRLDDASATAFHPGMGCRAEIDVGRGGDVVAVPQQAVVSADDDRRTAASSAFVVVDGVATRRPVTLGQSDDENVEITAGLAMGEAIVVGPAQALRMLHDGQRVRPLAAGGRR